LIGSACAMAHPTVKVKGTWEGKSAGGSMSSPNWRYNPQVFVSVSEPQEVSVTLAQDIKTKFFIGMIIGKSNGRTTRQLAFNADQFIERTEFEQNQTVKTTVQMEPGVTYVVIPCTYEPGNEGRWMLTFTSKSEVKITELPAAEEWKYVAVKGEWKGKMAGGCISQPNFIHNMQFVLKAEVPTHAVILLTQNEVENKDVLGIYVFETKTVKSKLTTFEPEELRASAEFSRTYEATCELDLQPKKFYAIIPCTYDGGFENEFELTVFGDNDIKLHELKNVAATAPVAKK